MFPPTAGPTCAPSHAVPVPPPLHYNDEPTRTPIQFIASTRTFHGFTSGAAFRLPLIEQNRIARATLRWLAEAADLPHERAKVLIIPGLNWSVAPEIRAGFGRYHRRGGRPAGTAYVVHVGEAGVSEADLHADPRMLRPKGIAARLAADVLLHEAAHALHAARVASLMTFAAFTAQLTTRLLGVEQSAFEACRWPRSVPALREISEVTARRLAACTAPTVPHAIRDGRLVYPANAETCPARYRQGDRS